MTKRTPQELREHYGWTEPGQVIVTPPTGTPDEIAAETKAMVDAARAQGAARLEAFRTDPGRRQPPPTGGT